MKYFLIFFGVLLGFYIAGVVHLNLIGNHGNPMLLIFVVMASLHVYLVAVVIEFISGFVFKIKQAYSNVLAVALGLSYVPIPILFWGAYGGANTRFFIAMVPVSVIINPYTVRLLVKFMQKAHNKA